MLPTRLEITGDQLITMRIVTQFSADSRRGFTVTAVLRDAKRKKPYKMKSHKGESIRVAVCCWLVGTQGLRREDARFASCPLHAAENSEYEAHLYA
jgi:hypothetical protein